jgi:hypothetical protein
MKRAAKILCIAVFITSLLTGFCSATPINENYNFLLDGSVWAVLNLQATESSGVWSYAYTLTNYLDLHPIHQLLLPVEVVMSGQALVMMVGAL